MDDLEFPWCAQGQSIFCSPLWLTCAPPEALCLWCWFILPGATITGFIIFSCALCTASKQTEERRAGVQSELRRGAPGSSLPRRRWSAPCPQTGGSTWREHSLWMSDFPGEEIESWWVSPRVSPRHSNLTSRLSSRPPQVGLGGKSPLHSGPRGFGHNKSPPATEVLAKERHQSSAGSGRRSHSRVALKGDGEASVPEEQEDRSVPAFGWQSSHCGPEEPLRLHSLQCGIKAANVFTYLNLKTHGAPTFS